jgi:hypothetical protein
MSTVTVTTFKWVPPIVQGLVRDDRIRKTVVVGRALQSHEEHGDG